MPPSSPTQIRRDLRAILMDGASFSVMVGSGETYLAPFVLAVGLGEVQAGFIASLPPLAGAVLQNPDLEKYPLDSARWKQIAETIVRKSAKKRRATPVPG